MKNVLYNIKKYLFLLFLLCVFSSCTTLKTVTYDIDSLKIDSSGFKNTTTTPTNLKSQQNSDYITLAIIADLHSCFYGIEQHELLDEVSAQNPDIILFAGDIIDESTNEFPSSNAYIVLKECAKICPCFYSTGNHEYYNKISAEKLKTNVENCDVKVLDGIEQTICIKNIEINICGIDDICAGIDIVEKELDNCANKIKIINQKNTSNYSVLISHRPFMIEKYLEYPFDLIICGHEHGGQFAIPGLINGFYSHEEGLLPQHSGGLYYYSNNKKVICKSRNNQLFISPVTQNLESQIMIVSRGLARETTPIPRIGNSPEFCIIKLH